MRRQLREYPTSEPTRKRGWIEEEQELLARKDEGTTIAAA
jgi:hypothetical protein